MLSISRIAFVRLAYLPERVNTLHRANSFAWYPFYHIKPESPSRSEYLSAFTRHFASATNHLRKPQSSSRYYPQDAQLSHRYTVHDRVIQHVRITITTILILTTHFFFVFQSLPCLAMPVPIHSHPQKQPRSYGRLHHCGEPPILSRRREISLVPDCRKTSSDLYRYKLY